jgi:hypothetical protein
MKFKILDELSIQSKYSIQGQNKSFTTQLGNLKSTASNVFCEPEELFINASNVVKFDAFLLKIPNCLVDCNNKRIFSISEREAILHPLISWNQKMSSEEIGGDVEIEYENTNVLKLGGNSLYLDSVWATSYFHFISETLGKCFNAALFDSLKKFDVIILTTNKFKYISEWFEILGIRDKLLESDLSSQYIIAENLYAPSFTQHCGWFSEELISYIRGNLFKPTQNLSKHTYRKIYISRTGTRRVLNENTLLDTLFEFGFEIYNLENYSQFQQALIFSQASIIIAPHGAGLTNLVYCQPNTKVFEFFGADYKNICYFSICDIMNLNYYYYISNAIDMGGNYFVDPAAIRKFLNK